MGDARRVVSAQGRAGRLLHVLTGCTAVGKTEWALRWAQAHSAEIISCDSLLFYRGMDIGTAKPARAELERVPHHLLDIREVSEPMNAALYASMALAAAEEIWKRGRSVLVVGGSGFYLKSFFAPVADGSAVPPEIRSRVADLLEDGGLAALVHELRRLNPGGLADLDTDNPRRVARALERCLASGRTLAELSSEFARALPTFAGWEVKLARLDRGGADLDARIDARVEAMLRAGLVGEVERLLTSGLRSNPSAARAIGYRETIEALEGRLPMASLGGAIARDTRALVKKQRTWFRTQLAPHPIFQAADLKDEELLFLG
jgi:tRNA dimethylallyltransferase